MFRGIKNTLNNKKNSLLKSDNKQNEIEILFKEFITHSFPQSIEYIKFSLDYDPIARRLVINTDNKTIANEIALHLTELSRILKRERVFLANIIIN